MMGDRLPSELFVDRGEQGVGQLRLERQDDAVARRPQRATHGLFRLDVEQQRRDASTLSKTVRYGCA